MTVQSADALQDSVLEDLKSQLNEFEEARKSTLKKISDIVPRLEKERKQLQSDIDQKKKRVQKIDEQISLINSVVKYYEAYGLQSTGTEEQLAMTLLKHIKSPESPKETKETAFYPKKAEKVTA